MRRTAAVCLCSLILQGSVVVECTNGQMPIGSAVTRVLPNANAKGMVPELRANRSRPFPGTLLLCGGGIIPLSIREEFYKLGLGEEGSLVLIPTASPRSDSGDYTMWIDYWSPFRWKSIEVVHAQTREGALNPALVAKMRGATAVWFSGGEQQRLSDRYVGTPIETELHGLLARGGIVGGTSAGAAIASSTMIASSRLIESGVEEPRFADGMQFLPGAIIDQHFSQRKRHGRLTKAIEAFPNRIGLGIDESTGLIVTEEQSRVVGDGAVFVLNAGQEYQRLQAGDSLKNGKLDSSFANPK